MSLFKWLMRRAGVRLEHHRSDWDVPPVPLSVYCRDYPCSYTKGQAFEPRQPRDRPCLCNWSLRTDGGAPE